MFAAVWCRRIQPGTLVVAIGGIPALTVVFAWMSGGLVSAKEGWGHVVLAVVLATGVNTVVVNLWEELGWAGFVQQRLMARHGVLLGSVLTAPAFAGGRATGRKRRLGRSDPAERLVTASAVHQPPHLSARGDIAL